MQFSNKNGLNIDFLGGGGFATLNYERCFLARPSFFLSTKLGFGFGIDLINICFSDNCSDEDSYLVVSYNFTGNIGAERHYLEFGLGGTRIIGEVDKKYFLYPLLGYRFMSVKDSGLILKITTQIPFSEIDNSDIVFFI